MLARVVVDAPFLGADRPQQLVPKVVSGGEICHQLVQRLLQVAMAAATVMTAVMASAIAISREIQT